MARRRFQLTTNTVESFFALLKHDYGIYHHWSRKYMTQYLREYDWRHDVRGLGDGERAVLPVKTTEGKRLMLKAPKDRSA